MKITPSETLNEKVACVRRVIEQANDETTGKSTRKRKAPPCKGRRLDLKGVKKERKLNVDLRRKTFRLKPKIKH